jgi:GT2 family glycosyltransferase
MTAVGIIAAQGVSVRPLNSRAFLISERHVGGYVLDPANLEARFVVELLVDGYPAGIARANLFDDELRADGFGDGCYGFVFGLDKEAAPAARIVQVRLANSGELVGLPVRIALGRAPARRDAEARWIGGLRFSGWIDNGRDGGRTVRALVDGSVVAEATANLWTHVGEGAEAMPVRAFDLNLPRRLADGRVRRARVVDESGRDLPGSPCAFVAFDDGLARFLEKNAQIESERLRGRLFDKMFPQSLPFVDYADWARSFPPDPPVEAEQPPRVAVVLVGEWSLGDSLASLEPQVGCTWIVGAMAAGDGQSAFRNGDLRQFLSADANDSDIFVFALSGSVFHPFALERLASALAAFPETNLAYCDYTVAGEEGAEWPIAFSAFDYERMLEQGYGAFLFAARASHVHEAAAKGVEDLFRMFNMAMDAASPSAEAADPRRPAHVPGFLARVPRPDVADGSARLARATHAHLETRGAAAAVRPGYGSLFPAARIERSGKGVKVSVVIPTRDRVDLLRPCIESLEKSLGDVDAEIIVVDNDSASPETLAYLDEISGGRIRVVYCSGAFNFSRLIGAGASIAGGEFLLLLNNDVEALRPGWLEEMVGRMAERDVGAVGAQLFWPSRVVQHGGVVLGPNFAAGHAFNERLEGDPGYGDLLVVAHECSAVTAACLLTRRLLFLELGGFDGTRFPVNFNDVDYCLRLRERGWRIIFTPYAKLLHHESASRGSDSSPDAVDRYRGELRNLQSAWGATLLNDPYYSPLLSLAGGPYTGLAWPPRDLAPRLPTGAAPRDVPPGF